MSGCLAPATYDLTSRGPPKLRPYRPWVGHDSFKIEKRVRVPLGVLLGGKTSGGLDVSAAHDHLNRGYSLEEHHPLDPVLTNSFDRGLVDWFRERGC